MGVVAGVANDARPAFACAADCLPASVEPGDGGCVPQTLGETPRFESRTALREDLEGGLGGAQIERLAVPGKVEVRRGDIQEWLHLSGEI